MAQGSSPLLEEVGRFGAGLFLGVLLAWVIAQLLQWRNLRGTFALPLSPVGYVALTGFGQLFYGTALLVAGVGAALFRAYFRRDDIKQGGEAARRAHEAVSLQTWIKNGRERRAIRHGRFVERGTYALGQDGARGVVRLPLGTDGGRHTLLIGATGTGKTTTLRWAIARHLDAGLGSIVIDAKGSPELVGHLRDQASRRGRPFYPFSLDSESLPWNPLAYGSPSERADKLIAAEEWTEPHYKRLYQRYLLAALNALEAREADVDLAQVVELLNPDRLALQCRELDGEASDRLSAYLDQLTQEERRDLSGLRNRLAILVEGEHRDLVCPIGEPAEEIDLLLAVNQGAVVVFSLNSSRYPETAKLLGAALFQDLKHVSGILEGRPELRRPAAIAIDEFAAFGADHVLGLFQRARSAGLSLLLSTQELADLRRVDPGFQDQVLGNVEAVIAHRQNVPDSAELVAGIAGTREVWEHTFQTTDPFGEALRKGDPRLGSKRRGHQYVVAPDTIKQLRTGEAVVIQKEPHMAKRIAVFAHERSRPAVPTATGREFEAARRRAAFVAMYPEERAGSAAEPRAA